MNALQLVIMLSAYFFICPAASAHDDAVEFLGQLYAYLFTLNDLQYLRLMMHMSIQCLHLKKEVQHLVLLLIGTRPV